MDSRLDKTKFAFAENLLLDVIVVKDIGVTDDFLDDLDPLILVFFVQKIVGPHLVSWEYETEGVQHCARVDLLFRLVLDEDSDKTVHCLMHIVLILVDVELLA